MKTIEITMGFCCRQVAQHIVGRHPSLLHGHIPVLDAHALARLHRRVGADIAGCEEVLAVLLKAIGKPQDL